MFKPIVDRGVQGGFIIRPFTKFKQFHENVKAHSRCKSYQEALEKSYQEAVENFLSNINNKRKDVNILLNQDLARQTEENWKKKLKSIISTIIFCTTHDLPLR